MGSSSRSNSNNSTDDKPTNAVTVHSSCKDENAGKV